MSFWKWDFIDGWAVGLLTFAVALLVDVSVTWSWPIWMRAPVIWGILIGVNWPIMERYKR